MSLFNVYRVLGEDGSPKGLSLNRIQQHESGHTFIPIEVIAEHESGVSVHLFGTELEADAFCSGLESSGEDPVLSSVGRNELGCWAVIREIVNTDYWNEISPAGKIHVVDHRPSEPVTSREPVDHWDSKRYGGESYDPRQGYVMEVSDQRLWNGQVFAGILHTSNTEDEGLSVLLEVNSLLGNEDRHMPCLHVHFGTGNLAFSIFQDTDKKLILRPENGVRITSGEMLPNGNHAFSVEEN
jgi:hypothetical protein